MQVVFNGFVNYRGSSGKSQKIVRSSFPLSKFHVVLLGISWIMAEFLREKIFNIHEDEITFDSFIKFSIISFKIVFIEFEPIASDLSFGKRLTYWAKTLMAVMFFVSSALAFSQPMVYAVTSDSFVEGTRALLDASSMFLVTMKPIITFVNKNVIWEICQEMNLLFNSRDNRNGKYKIKAYLDSFQGIVKVCGLFIAALLIPVFYTIVPYLIDGTMKLSAPFWFPFNPFQLETFPIASFWIDYIGVLDLFFLLASDSLLYSLMTTISMELDILKNELINLSLTPNDERKYKTVKLIDRHNKLLDLSAKLQDIYAPTFLGCFVVTSIILCICLFQLSTGDNDTTDIMLYVPYLGIFSGQIFLLCMFGQKLIDSSSSIADGIYNCDWIDNDDIDFKKSVLMITIRAQKPIQLTAMKFAKVSLESFTAV